MLHSTSFRRLLAATLLTLAAPLASALGVNSCIGTEACTGVDTSLIGNNACNGDFACKNLKPQALVENACNGLSACWDAGTGSGLTMTIGSGSCIGPSACQTQNNPNPVTVIGANSCVGQSACGGWSNFFRVADNACQGFFACISGTGVVGTSACNGARACLQHYFGFSVDNRSCVGDDACANSSGNISVDSCNGTSACKSHSGRIGVGSCNGPMVCSGGNTEIPDCAFDVVRPPFCVNPELRITITDGVTRPTPGGTVTYTIVASNDAGTNTEGAAIVVAAFPAALSGCSVTSVAAGGAGGNDPGPTATLNDSGLMLPASASVTYTAVCTISPSASGMFSTAVSIAGSSIDPVPYNDTAQDYDTLPYTVSGFATVADTGDGVLASDEVIDIGATQILVGFTGAMSDPAGDTVAGDVTDAANYLLLFAGANDLLDTASCATPMGDDVEVPLAGVRYDAGSSRATLLPLGTRALRAGVYRIDVCNTILDNGGYAIRGASRTFRVLGSNRLVQPNFDADLAGWSGTGANQWSNADAGAAATSGSANIVTGAGAGVSYDLEQCIPVADRYFTARARLRIATPTAGAPNASVVVDHFASNDCTGTALASSASTPIVGDTASIWQPTAVEGRVPLTAHSTRFRVHVLGDTADVFAIDVDDAYYGDPGKVFDEGFE